MKLKGVVFDWAGTIIDFGSLAPMGAFVRLFANHGVTLTIAQARIPMGLPKLAHIEALGAMPDIAAQWQQASGHAFNSDDAMALLHEFEPMSAKAALDHSAFVPGFMQTYRTLCERGMGVATTTGYTRRIMEPLISIARDQGFAPALVVCCDDVARSRPHPDGMQACMRALALENHPACVVKVDDTAPGIAEGRNAGCWTVGVAASGNALGWSWEEWVQSSEDERTKPLTHAIATLRAGGAHEVVASVADLAQALVAIEARMLRGENP